MTDKIIIDGVDVSGCIHYEEYFEEDEDVKIKDFCALWYNSCHSCNNCNCNFKNWQRAEQECETKQKALELQKCWIDNLEFQRNKLKQTLTEIKEITEKHKATAHCDYLTDMDKILEKIKEVIKDERIRNKN